MSHPIYTIMYKYEYFLTHSIPTRVSVGIIIYIQALKSLVKYYFNTSMYFLTTVRRHTMWVRDNLYLGVAFSKYDEIELVAMTDCGDCPGLSIPRVKLLKEITNGLDRPMIHSILGPVLN